MEELAPSLQFCLTLRFAIENGSSVFVASKKGIQSISGDFALDLTALIVAHEQGRSLSQSELRSTSLYRRALIEVVAAGLKGEPIIKQIAEIEAELCAACEAEVDNFVAKLPIRALLPLMLMQFPAFLLLVLGPIMSELTRGLNS